MPNLIDRRLFKDTQDHNDLVASRNAGKHFVNRVVQALTQAKKAIKIDYENPAARLDLAVAFNEGIETALRYLAKQDGEN